MAGLRGRVRRGDQRFDRASFVCHSYYSDTTPSLSPRILRNKLRHATQFIHSPLCMCVCARGGIANAGNNPLKSLAFLKLTALKQTVSSVIDIHKHTLHPPANKMGLGRVWVQGSNERQREGVHSLCCDMFFL